MFKTTLSTIDKPDLPIQHFVISRNTDDRNLFNRKVPAFKIFIHARLIHRRLFQLVVGENGGFDAPVQRLLLNSF